MTYTTLKTTIADYLNRSDLTSQIANFVHFAQRKIERTARWDGMKNRATFTASVGDHTITVPDRIIDIATFEVRDPDTDARYPMRKATDAEILEIYPDTTNDTGLPKFFCYLEPTSEFLVRPTCDKAYAFDLTYYRYSAELSADSDTNWITNNYPELLIYMALMEAQPFLKDDKRIEVWASLAGTLMSTLAADQTMRWLNPNMDFYAR